MVAALRDTVEKLRHLLSDGFCLHSIDSDHHSVHATLRRGSLLITLTLSASEAERLLFGPRTPPR